MLYCAGSQQVYTEREEWGRAYSLYNRIKDNSAIAGLVEKAGTSTHSQCTICFAGKMDRCLTGGNPRLTPKLNLA